MNFIGNADATGMTVQPRTVILLTADAFGVLPPIARLTHAQAAYHFISGYTAKLAGTEIGVQGAEGDVLGVLRGAVHAAPPRRVRADAHRAARAHQDAEVWLVNTGWTGGPYGDRGTDEHRSHAVDGPCGARRPARACRDAHRPDFGFEVPLTVPGRAAVVPGSALDMGGPRCLRPSAHRLATMFVANFKVFADGVTDESARPDPSSRIRAEFGLELSGPGEG